MMNTSAIQLIGVAEGAKKLGVSIWTLRSYAYKGVVASVKIGTRLMFEEGELDRYIAENTRPRFRPMAERRVSKPAQMAG